MDRPEIKILLCHGILFRSWRRKKYVKHASGSHAKKEERPGRSVDLLSSGNIRYGIRGYEERVIGHDGRRSPGAWIFFGFPAQKKCDELYTWSSRYDRGRMLASLERGKFTVLAIKSSLSHYIDSQRLHAPSIRQLRGIRLRIICLFNTTTISLIE